MKKLTCVSIIRIAATILMLAALFSACFGSNQSTKSFPFPIEFKGEYSLDSGKTWQTLPESPDISAKYDSVILKGGFGMSLPDGVYFNFYLDHITMDIYVNGE